MIFHWYKHRRNPTSPCILLYKEQEKKKKQKKTKLGVLDPPHKVYCHNNFHNFGHKSPTRRFVNGEKKVGSCKFTISPLTNRHIDKL